MVNRSSKSVIRLDNVPVPVEGGSLVAQTTEPAGGSTSVRFRKGAVNEKDIFVEVWSQERGFVSSLKVTDKMKMVYNDAAFGGIQWSRDGTKILFIGEKPDISAYKPFFKDEEEPKKEAEATKEESKEEKKPEDKPEEHWQDEKFLYKEHFGETLTNK